MSLPQVVKQIQRLTYSEMMSLMEELAGALHAKTDLAVPAVTLAEIISELQKHAVETLNKQEESLLRAVFNRKRSISIEKDGAGWTVDISTVSGARASALDLREALTRCIDQAVTLEALKK